MKSTHPRGEAVGTGEDIGAQLNHQQDASENPCDEPETAMNDMRYTESQVLFGLREVWASITGGDDLVDADAQIYSCMRADGSWEEVDFTDVYHEIECFFGFRCSEQEWNQFFGFDKSEPDFKEWERTIAPSITFGSLARFIAERASSPASFDPISLFGRKCASAGAFTGIHQLVENTMRRPVQFPPSARIIDVMRGNTLDRFWSHLRWMTEGAIPELPPFWRRVLAATGCLGVLAIFGAVIRVLFAEDSSWIMPVGVAAVICFSAAWTYKHFVNPLPSHIATFRDLSTLIAKSQT